MLIVFEEHNTREALHNSILDLFSGGKSGTGPDSPHVNQSTDDFRDSADKAD